MNKLGAVVKILLLNVLLYSLISLLPNLLEATKLPDLLSDIKKPRKENRQVSYVEEGDSISLESDSIIDNLNTPLNVDDTSLIGFGDFSKIFTSFLAHEYETTAVHIAYFGDSMIEGDLLTADLRNKLQSRFSGFGVGFMPITSLSSTYRNTIQHTFNNKWTSYHFNKRPPKGVSLGVSGYSFKGKPLATVKFIKNKKDKSYSRAHIFYSSINNSNIKLETDSNKLEINLKENNGSGYYLLSNLKPFGKFQLEINSGDPILYGINLEGGNGVYVDNFSFRGHSGTMLASIPKGNYKAYSEALTCKLVILQYGLNVVGHNVGDYSWYKRGIKKAIQQIKNSFPDATILLISVSDKSYSINKKFQTEPDIPIFVNLQAKIAKEEGVCFWNLYKSMGGYNSMKRWVEEERPRLGNFDYTHLNHQGAKRAADLLYQWLMEEFELFKTKNRNAEKPI